MAAVVGLPVISIEYDPARLAGRLTLVGQRTTPIWERLRARGIEDPRGRALSDTELELPWPAVLGIVRDFGTKQQQQAFGFRFRAEGEASRLVRQFAEELKVARAARNKLGVTLHDDEVRDRLRAVGFVRRELRPFQVRDLIHLASMPHGANFSVPGAGKTTVTLALDLLTRSPDEHLLVVGPKSCFPAWQSVIADCLDVDAGANSEAFTVLDADERENERRLLSGATRFLMSYDLMVRQQSMLAAHLARRPTHLVLDEAHRMKAGVDSQRGAFLLSVAGLPVRRDILTGTPMPQGPMDLASQLSFLWPGHGLGLRIQRGEIPRAVLGNLYVRTTKRELGLPKARRHYIDVPMLPGQQALYAIVRSDTLRQLSAAIRRGRDSLDYIGARRSVMRLLQLSVNPVLALKGISEDFAGINSGVIDKVIEESVPAKMGAVVEHARSLSRASRKVVIWTIFTENVLQLERLLADQNPVTLYGAVPSGSPSDLATREGRIRRFHQDAACRVLIANPAAAGEGISLHEAAHDAIYLDRSYVSTHYLQSIDRIHRLGLLPDTETNIYIYRTKAPAQLGSIDFSVSRRLAQKIRGLQALLDDPDLHEIALDEENADDPVDYAVDLQDLVDLVAELEGKVQAAEDENF
jgi:SNF2 family DNA or RNA helicase